ncbi:MULTISPECIES: NAD(P)H-dependent flavin oxidoreductase [Actinoalloteichus]|uniref:NAD(P)H-dependent flavin oxidoreductase n=1 Tax=Actinoalloteichus TaxID=65496 RepID=UPI000953679B|nr:MULTISPECIES: nitronate monooxygenase [Actinoalloteichus]
MVNELRVPIVAAPMAGGVSTPELVVAVGEAGGLGFLAAGYLSPDRVKTEIHRVRSLSRCRFGVNLFVPGEPSGADLSAFRELVADQGRPLGVAPGEPRWDDDDYRAKLALLLAEPVPVVSFTFGVPAAQDVRRLQRVGSQVVVTVTSPDEARQAVAAGTDGLCLQGIEAGGHRAVFVDDGRSEAGGPTHPLLDLIGLVRAQTTLPLIAAGGLTDGRALREVLAAGAGAGQFGTAFLRSPEAGTKTAHRSALTQRRGTALTRAFTGRPARGLVNEMMTELTAHAPAAYPEIHHLTAPVRAAAGAAEDPERMSAWAGLGADETRELPAAELVAAWGAEIGRSA